MSRPLMVTVTIAVPIDREAWELNYCNDESDAVIRSVVKQTADEVVTEHFRKVGVLAETS